MHRCIYIYIHNTYVLLLTVVVSSETLRFFTEMGQFFRATLHFFVVRYFHWKVSEQSPGAHSGEPGGMFLGFAKKG